MNFKSDRKAGITFYPNFLDAAKISEKETGSNRLQKLLKDCRRNLENICTYQSVFNENAVFDGLFINFAPQNG